MTSLRIHFMTQCVSQMGTYFRSHNLAVGLAELGHQVTVFGGDFDSRSKERVEIRDGIQYHIIPEYKGTSFFGAACHPLTAIKRCFLDYPACDVAHLFQPFPSAAWPWIWALRKKSKLMFYDWDDLWIEGLIKDSPKSFREFWTKTSVGYLEQHLPKVSYHVTACSQFLAHLAAERKARKVTILRNGFWPFEIPDKRSARESLGLDPQAVYVGFMGRTTAELPWCFEALGINSPQHKNLRFALCGPTIEILNGLPDDILRRTDFLGSLPPLKTREFAAAIDLGLLPLDDNAFNQSRFPIKYAEYMAAGIPVLCSDIGECAQLSINFPWVVKAGRSKAQWLESFKKAVSSAVDGQLPRVDLKKTENSLSWPSISKELLRTYLADL